MILPLFNIKTREHAEDLYRRGIITKDELIANMDYIGEKWFLVYDKLNRIQRVCLYNALYDTYWIFDVSFEKKKNFFPCYSMDGVFHKNTSRAYYHGKEDFEHWYKVA